MPIWRRVTPHLVDHELAEGVLFVRVVAVAVAAAPRRHLEVRLAAVAAAVAVVGRALRENHATTRRDATWRGSVRFGAAHARHSVTHRNKCDTQRHVT